ncbi:unnamed protein product [Pleuronectes platessa]|uniref:Uncharacterized protein n=1 Tax=Pleuronectes platessa TaxID=8262 RepID=A0A9N7VQH8_PLEPL|nr:unnamed protein product [Pleuronectes platessa]
MLWAGLSSSGIQAISIVHWVGPGRNWSINRRRRRAAEKEKSEKQPEPRIRRTCRPGHRDTARPPSRLCGRTCNLQTALLCE